MRKYLIVIFIIVLVIVIMITSLLLCRRQNPAVPARITLIKTSMPQHKDFNDVIHFFGRAQAKNKVVITALEAGAIFSVDAADESFVKKGDVIFTLGGVRVNASTAAIEQKIESLKQRQALAKAAVGRKQRAVSQKIVSFDELDKAKSVLASLNTQLQQAEGQLDILKNAVRIHSPMSGIFTRRRVSAGQKVEKTDMLAEIVDSNELRVAATLFPPQDAQLKGRSAAIHTAGGKILSGVVSSVLSQRTSAGGTVLWIQGDDINRKLKPGEAVSGDILLAAHQKALALPAKAIVRDERERTYVFVKQAGGYIKQQVQTGLSSDGWVEILAGITQADEVVTEGAYELFYRDFNKVYKVAD